MGTWSITPNNGLASIDANSGVATFKEHTSDVTYTIKFSDSTCTGGEVTKTFMVFACSQPTCVCSTFSATTSSTRVPSTISSTEYIVGRYTAATNCTDSITITPRTGTDFLTGLRVSGGNIYAKVAVANTGSERSSTYFVRQGGCEDYFTAYQSSGGTPPTPTTCTCTATPVTTSLPSGITSDVTVGSYSRSGDCSGAYRAKFTGSGTNFLGNFNFSSSVIKANVTSTNTTTSPRTATYRIYRGDTLCSSNFTVTQAAGSPTPTCTCNDLKVSGDKTIDSSARSNFEIGTYTAGCVTNIAASEPADWITRISANNGSIKASVKENTSTTNTRATEITVTGKAGSDTCTKSFTLTQNPKSETCTTCNDANIQGLSGGATAEGGTNILIGSFSYSCNPGFTAKRVSGGDFITNMTVSHGNVYGTVSSNTATTPRTEDIGIYVGTSKCAQYTLTQQGATPVACTCHDITLSNSAVTIDSDGTKTKIGTITQGCEVGFTGTPWITISVEGSNIMVSASANETTEPRIGSGSIGIKDVGSCKEIKVTQLGVLKTYDITVYPTYNSSINRVTVDVDYDGVSSPGSTYFRLKKEGCSVNITYENCIGSEASPILPAGNTIPICVEPGSGGESSIQRGTTIITKTVACTFIIGGNEETQTSHDDVKEYTYLNFIYRVIVKTNR